MIKPLPPGARTLPDLALAKRTKQRRTAVSEGRRSREGPAVLLAKNQAHIVRSRNE